MVGSKKIFLAALLLLLLAAAPHTGLEGSWKLVEQHYGEGRNNLVDLERPVRLEFVRQGTGVAGRIWADAGGTGRLEWPAFVNDQGPLPLEVVERRSDPSRGQVFVRYRVQPSPADDLVLDVVEQYQVQESGTALVGTLEVTFYRGDDRRGSFVLHRRFVRAP